MLLPTVSSQNQSCGLMPLRAPCMQPVHLLRASQESFLKYLVTSTEPSASKQTSPKSKEWSDGIPPEILAQIPESEKRRQK
jgi:hypothetical protein